MMKEIDIKWEGADGLLQSGKVMLRMMEGGETTEIESKAKIRVGNVFTTDDRKVRFTRMARFIVDAPFKPAGKAWKDASENERFEFLVHLHDDVVAYILLSQSKMGHMMEDTENLLNSQ